MVAAWISAETGVGPCMASGSQIYRGIWADLPVQPRNKKSVIAVAAAPPGRRAAGALVKTVSKSSDPRCEDEEHRHQEPEVPDPVDDERLLARVGVDLLVEPEADEQIGAEPGPLPGDEHARAARTPPHPRPAEHAHARAEEAPRSPACTRQV